MPRLSWFPLQVGGHCSFSDRKHGSVIGFHIASFTILHWKAAFHTSFKPVPLLCRTLAEKGPRILKSFTKLAQIISSSFPADLFRKTQQTMENTLSGSRALALTSSLPCKFSVFLACPIRLLSLIYGPKTAGQNRYLHNCRDFGQNGSIFSSGL